MPPIYIFCLIAAVVINASITDWGEIRYTPFRKVLLWGLIHEGATTVVYVFFRVIESNPGATLVWALIAGAVFYAIFAIVFCAAVFIIQVWNAR